MRNVTLKSVLLVILLTVAALLTAGMRCGEGFPPNIPARPIGPTSVRLNETAIYATVTTDPHRPKVKYVFDWADSTSDTTGYFKSGDTATASHAWHSIGVFPVKAWAVNEGGHHSSDWSDTLNVTVDDYHNPYHPPDSPLRPTHTGIDSVLKPIVFSTSATDPDGDSVRIKFYFGDGEPTSYGPRVASGATFADTTAYQTGGWKVIYAVAMDTYGDTSAVSAPDSIFINSPPPSRSPRTQ